MRESFFPYFAYTIYIYISFIVTAIVALRGVAQKSCRRPHSHLLREALRRTLLPTAMSGPFYWSYVARSEKYWYGKLILIDTVSRDW